LVKRLICSQSRRVFDDIGGVCSDRNWRRPGGVLDSD
jgi:hypothetical protein